MASNTLRFIQVLRAAALVCAVASAPACVAAGTNAVRTVPADVGTYRLVVKLKDNYRSEFGQALGRPRLDTLSGSAGIALRNLRPMSGNANVLAMPRVLRGAALDAVVARVAANPAVEYAYADRRDHLMAVPNDPLFNSQTYLQTPGAAAPLVDSLNLPVAWNSTLGSASVIVAVIDGGVRFDHPDLAGHLLAGYDFVSADCDPVADAASGCTAANQFTTANDGDGRDPDASDPGDWVTATEVSSNPELSGCTAENSSWHGTHIAGIIGAKSNNGVGIAGINQNATILPLRVAGKCGAYQSDVADAMRWAVGISVPGVPDNTQPAKILNISLGSTGSCAASAYSTAVPDVLAKGAVIVAAAGNEDNLPTRPGNCSGVFTIGAVRGDGMRATYSNSGANVLLMAPGGDYLSATNDLILSTSNSGSTVPVSNDYDSEAGTSFSAPMASGVISLMLSVNATLTNAQIQSILQQTARPFVITAGANTCVAGGSGNTNNTTPCNCTTAACGAGYLDAAAAVQQALALAAPPVVTTPPPTTPTTPVTTSSGGGGGGGGSLDLLSLILLAGIALWSRRRPSRQQ